MAHPKADALLLLSNKLGGINDKPVLNLLLDDDAMFSFVQTQFQVKSPSITELNQAITQFSILKKLALKTNLPIDQFYHVTNDQVYIYNQLSERH